MDNGALTYYEGKSSQGKLKGVVPLAAPSTVTVGGGKYKGRDCFSVQGPGKHATLIACSAQGASVSVDQWVAGVQQWIDHLAKSK